MNLHGCAVKTIESVVDLYESQKDVYAIQDKFDDDLYIDVIIDILKKYKYLKSKGLYHAPADVKNFKGSEDELPVVVPSEFVIPCGRAQGPTEILIQLYEEGKKVGYIQKEIYERYYQVIKLGDAYKKCGMWDEIERYWNDKEIKKYIRIYRYLKEQGLYHVPADVDIFDACADIDNLPSALSDKETPIEKGAAKEKSAKELPIKKLLIEKKVERSELHEAKQMMPRPVKPYEDIVADPSKSFEIMKKAVAVIAKRVGKALLITGNGGIGKTYAVQEVLESYGYREYEDYEVIKTKSTAFSLYQLMYENRDKICIFDDCDSILRDVEGRSVLKSALDSTSRDVSWNSQRNNIVNTRNCRNNDEVEETLKKWSVEHNGQDGVPNRFFFQGSAIIISNMRKEDIKNLEEALVTRTQAVEIWLSNEEILKRLEGILPHFTILDRGNRDIGTPELKKRVFDWISSKEFLEDPRMQGKSLNFRLFLNTYRALYATDDGSEDWKQVAFQG